MFKNKKSKIDPNMTDTLIGEGSLFEGKIKSDAGIRVEGQMTGDIDSAGDVTVGENGVARSNIKARNVILAGHVVGNISVKGKLTIKASGKLHGNLSAAELSIESGGEFQGSSKMDVKDAQENPGREPEPVTPIATKNEKVEVLKTW